MLGWRARFGLMIPSLNTTTECELYRCLPEGVTAHFTRMEFKETTPEYFERMIDDISAGARMLSHARVDAILFGCTSGSFTVGWGMTRKSLRRLENIATSRPRPLQLLCSRPLRP